MLKGWLRKLFGVETITVLQESPMHTVVYKALVVTHDGTAKLEFEAEKQVVLPRAGENVYITTCVRRADDKAEIEGVVQDVTYDPIGGVATVHVETDLDLRDGHKIDCIVGSAQEDGWELEEPIDYHGCCKGGKQLTENLPKST
jgi:hypothetical protein